MNEIVQQVVDTIRRDILQNKDFIRDILSKIELTEKNVPTELILSMMNQYNAQQPAPRPISNAPKQIAQGEAVARPIAIGQGGLATKIISDLLEGNNVYLMGKAGTGKTYLAKAVAAALGQPVYVINCSQWTSPIEIKGGQTITGYQEGLLIEAWANGGVLILDELPKLDPNTAGLLNDALAEAATQPKYDTQGMVIENTIPTLTNGRGTKIPKGNNLKDNPDLRFRFCVIGTGNTDMMNVGNKYSGNQRQDYSLVDRFAGSYYVLEQDTLKERELTYAYVFGVCNAMREFLNEKDALQSISIRTMLNFNRTYEQEMLYVLESPYADKIYDNLGNPIPPKSIKDSIESFLAMMEKNMREQLEEYQPFRLAVENTRIQSQDFFKYEFMVKYHRNPLTEKVMNQEEVEAARKELTKKEE